MTRKDDHESVLLEPAVNALVVDDSGYYLEGTFGRGGHSREILSRLGPDGRLYAIDQDPQAVLAGRSLAETENRLVVEQGNFADLCAVAERHNIMGQVCGVLLDLGVSSPQLDDAQRGFSFTRDGPLDMRMNPEQGRSAADWINAASESEIADVLWRFGEERFSRRMARAIVAARREQPLTSTVRLAELVKQANPAWEKDKHPATRAFQAIRIAVNSELEALEKALQQALEVLRIGGRLVVISFHSLEDKIVKKFISLQTKGDNFPRALPIRHSELSPRLIAVGKPVRPDPSEIHRNPRARSAVMRVAEKIA